MSEPVKTKIRIDEIPAELCTRKEAAQILGCRAKSASLIGANTRFRHLPAVKVIYHGHSILLYNRKMVESMKYMPAPDGYITTKDAGLILGLKSIGGIQRLLRQHGLQPKTVKRHHSFLVWKRDEVEKVKKMREK